MIVDLTSLKDAKPVSTLVFSTIIIEKEYTPGTVGVNESCPVWLFKLKPVASGPNGSLNDRAGAPTKAISSG